MTYDLLTCIRASVRPIFIANSSLEAKKKKRDRNCKVSEVIYNVVG